MRLIIITAWIALSLPIGIVVGRFCGAGSRLERSPQDPMVPGGDSMRPVTSAVTVTGLADAPVAIGGEARS